MKKLNNYAFIDSQNLNLAIRDQGWILDFSKFKVYLKEKHSVNKVFLFIDYVPDNEKLYSVLQNMGYSLIFKPTITHKGTIKGNVDAELVLHTMIEYRNFDNTIIVSGDGDFHCLIEYLIQNNKLQCLLIPNKLKYSSLLRKFKNHIDYLNKQRHKLQKTLQ